MDSRCSNRWPWFRAEGAGGAEDAEEPFGSVIPSGCHGGVFPFSNPVALASIAAVTAADIRLLLFVYPASPIG